MPFDARKFLREHGTNLKTTKKMPGYGTVTLDGCVEEASDAAILDLLSKQEPTPKVLDVLAFMVAREAPAESNQRALCEILAQQPPTDELLNSLANLLAEQNPHIHSLVEGQRPTQSALKTLTNLLARQEPSRRTLEALAKLLAEQTPSRQLQSALISVAKAEAT